MREQLYLPDIPKPPAPRDHLFLAIFPDDSTAGNIAKLASRLRTTHGLGNKQLATNRFHVSLYSLGTHSGVPGIVVRAASKAAVAVAVQTLPFKVRFNRMGSFSGNPGNRPFVLRASSDNAALMEFHRHLGAELGKCGFPYDGNSKFTPHMTLLYSEQGVAEESIEEVGWTVNEFVLVHSLLGKTRHIPLARWMLLGQTGYGRKSV
jgi:RNA 2',3'-cyclic 3'-phosphodiesterase